MKVNYFSKFLCTVAISIACFTNSSTAQVSNYSFSVSNSAYVAITGGTVLGNTTSNDEYFVSPLTPLGGTAVLGAGFPIGFNFPFNGDTVNKFGVSANGWMIIDSGFVNLSGANNSVPLSATTPHNIIAALGFDLQAQNNSAIRFATIGTAPNRILVVQWEHYKRVISVQPDDFNFQIRLSEADGNIAVNYGTVTSGSQQNNVCQVGIKGAAADVNMRTTNTNWLATTATTNTTAGCTVNNTVFPASGTIFNWVIPVPCTQPPSAGIAAASANPQCAASTIVSVTGTSTGSGVSLQWRVSTDSITWATITGATAKSYIVSQTSSHYYHCVVTCTGVSDSSNAVLVAGTSSTNTCYCTNNNNLHGNNTCAIGGPINDVSIAGTTLSNLNSGCSSLTGASYSAYPATGNLTATLYPGLTYSLSITTAGNHVISVWIDYNQNGVFDLNEWTQVATTSTANVANVVSITIPNTALLGTTGMRIRSRGGNGTNNAGSACTSFQSGETEDYLITIAQQFPCTAPPTAGAAISSAIKVCPDETFSLQLSGGTSGSGQSYQWQTSTDSVVWANVVGATNISYSTTQSQNTYYRCYVTCSTLSDTSTAIKITTKTAIECYCTSSATNTGDDDIGNVTFGNINNGIGTPATNNATSTHLYTDFTTLTPDTFTETLTYPISITQINFGNNTFACWISVYIDYNHDGTFDVPGDLAFVSRSAQGAGGNVVSGNITFPPNSAGQTRMRIVMNEQGSATQTACGPYQWGETEDYTIVIKAQAPCVGPPDAGIILASSSAVCPNQTINFSLQGATQGSGMTYQWQSSADSLVWLDIAAATNYIYSTTQSQTTYYRCVLTCSGMGDTSTAVKVNQKSANQCYCDSYALNANDSDIGNVTFGGINNGTSTPVTNNPAANKTYTDFTSLTPSTFVESVNYPITVNQINSNNFFAAQVSVFIDYSKDGIFQTSELAFTARSAASALGNLVSGTITIPVGVAGTTRMRVVLNEQGNAGQTACGTYPYGETEDYLITVVAQTPCVSPPSAGNALANFTSVCSTNTITFNLSGGAAGTGMSYQWQSSTDSINYNDIAGATNYFYSSTQNGSTYYRCVLACSGLSDTSTSVLVTQKAVVDCYCTSNANNTADADIGNVTFGNLNNGLATPALNNPASNHTYTNFTTLAPETFIENASYTLSVTQINSANFFPSWVRVFIDYNMDGDFDDAGEAVLVAQTNNTAGGNTITGTVTIPSGVQGNTRMRVVMNSTGSATLSACGTYAWGETEDYTIHLELFVGIKTINNTVNGFVIAPNPANGSTKISYMLADKNNVSLDVYNLVGEKITSLVNETQNVGKRTIDFDTKSMGMKAGVYLLKIKTGSSAQTLRLVVMD